jgi:hypothetical protein
LSSVRHTYGYYTNLATNTLLAVLFAICALIQLALGRIYHLKLYPVLGPSAASARLLGISGALLCTPTRGTARTFIMKSLLLIVFPSLLAAGLYLTLKHLMLHYRPEYSRLWPVQYTWSFIACDAIGFFTMLV